MAWDDDLFGGFFDFDGDGNTSLDEEFMAFMMFNEMNKENDDNDDFDIFNSSDAFDEFDDLDDMENSYNFDVPNAIGGISKTDANIAIKKDAQSADTAPSCDSKENKAISSMIDEKQIDYNAKEQKRIVKKTIFIVVYICIVLLIIFAVTRDYSKYSSKTDTTSRYRTSSTTKYTGSSYSYSYFSYGKTPVVGMYVSQSNIEKLTYRGMDKSTFSFSTNKYLYINGEYQYTIWINNNNIIKKVDAKYNKTSSSKSAVKTYTTSKYSSKYKAYYPEVDDFDNAEDFYDYYYYDFFDYEDAEDYFENGGD